MSSSVITPELKKSIRQYIDYYFSDFNLNTNRFMRELLDRNPSGIPVEMLLKLVEIKQLVNNDVNILKKIVEGLDFSSTVVKFLPDTKRIVRNPSTPFTYSGDYIRVRAERTIFCKSFPAGTTVFDIVQWAAKYETNSKWPFGLVVRQIPNVETSVAALIMFELPAIAEELIRQSLDKQVKFGGSELTVISYIEYQKEKRKQTKEMEKVIRLEVDYIFSDASFVMSTSIQELNKRCPSGITFKELMKFSEIEKAVGGDQKLLKSIVERTNFEYAKFRPETKTIGRKSELTFTSQEYLESQKNCIVHGAGFVSPTTVRDIVEWASKFQPLGSLPYVHPLKRRLNFDDVESALIFFETASIAESIPVAHNSALFVPYPAYQLTKDLKVKLDLTKNLRLQIDYYFSDFNLWNNAHMRDLILNHPYGLSPKELLKFNVINKMADGNEAKLRTLLKQTDLRGTFAKLNKRHNLIRNPDLPFTYSKDYMKTLSEKTVFVTKFPTVARVPDVVRWAYELESGEHWPNVVPVKRGQQPNEFESALVVFCKKETVDTILRNLREGRAKYSQNDLEYDICIRSYKDYKLFKNQLARERKVRRIADQSKSGASGGGGDTKRIKSFKIAELARKRTIIAKMNPPTDFFLLKQHLTQFGVVFMYQCKPNEEDSDFFLFFKNKASLAKFDSFTQLKINVSVADSGQVAVSKVITLDVCGHLTDSNSNFQHYVQRIRNYYRDEWASGESS